VTVDSDTSTSDTTLVFATGTSQAAPLDSLADARLETFSQALHEVLRDLAQQIVRDGEGATKLVEVLVEGAASDQSAKRIALSIANSPLVKTAVAGEDANWGRVVMAVGKAGEPADRDKLSIAFGGITITKRGKIVPGYDEALVERHLQGREIGLAVDVGIGKGCARVWTCDLTHGYIEINADYRT
jgi:glutamate N-acetyltransferase/amino-acid N-acetyltransferase